MELVDGPNLSERLRSAGPMPAAAVARLGAALADALDHVHRRGITHRDVKPGNVLLGERPMLADFGIARLVDTARITQTGFLIGTPAYLAPEQISGGEVGEPADVYALGLVLLEALTGRREFEGEGPEVAFARLSRRPEVPDGWPGLTDLLRTMTDPEPGARPPAADVVAALRRAAPDLDRAAAGPGAERGAARAVPAAARAVPAAAEVGPHTQVLPPTARKAGAASWLGRRKPLVGALAVLLAAGAGAGAAALRPVSDQPVPPSSAPAQPAPAKQRVTPTPERSAESGRRDSGDEDRDSSRSNRDDSSRSSRENGSGSSTENGNRDSGGSGSGDSGSGGSGSSDGGSGGSNRGGLLPIG